MVTSTVLVIFFAPLFYVMIYKLMTKQKNKRTGPAEESWIEGEANE